MDFPSVAVLKIVKATEVIFRRKVIENDIAISKEKHLDQKIQNSVLEHLGLAHFRSSLSHLYVHNSRGRKRSFIFLVMNSYQKIY